ncbi:hypothetical protein [Bacillus sp. Marseille-Q3570]|uniref:hypothetical protein n=1 Tax=Bacillus sp. Marseille-Q3570 TaxID=2963522 RepID=UPI0021B7BA16|nr:hypothetical protein [Bacillus sp. Marseille-Q3570]
MKRLDEQAFNRAKEFLLNNGRELEKALFRYHFEDGSEGDVLRALKNYQNMDGGFGRRLEPDFQLDKSSPMSTSIAFQIFKELEVPADHALVRDAMNYLVENYDHNTGRWHAVPPEVNDVPHAPWWHYDHENERVMVEEAWGNPNAELAGYFLRYKECSPEEVRENLKSRSITYFMELDTLGSMHETFCYLRFAEELSTSDRERIVEKVREHIPELVDLRREQWSNYGMQPVQLAVSPDAPFYMDMKEEVEDNLDYIIEQQQSDGSWHPNWEWGQYEQDWPKAKDEWKGILTYQNLKLLRNYGRVEKQAVQS